jgi:hypothetical protein
VSWLSDEMRRSAAEAEDMVPKYMDCVMRGMLAVCRETGRTDGSYFLDLLAYSGSAGSGLDMRDCMNMSRDRAVRRRLVRWLRSQGVEARCSWFSSPYVKLTWRLPGRS